MAIYHCTVKPISRGQGRSAIGSAAYRAGEKLENERDGLTHDYTHKQGIEHTEIITPEHAPDWAKNRQQLWNEVEKAETRINSRTAREIEVAVPKELNREQQIELLREYTKENFVDKGMVADIALHDKKDGNPHAHIMLTTREIDQGGFTNKNRDWDKKEYLEQWREGWEKKANLALERAGHHERIDHRSYIDQGIEKIPTVHLGVDAAAMEKRGIQTEKGNINREIQLQNKELESIDKQIIDLQKYREQKQEQAPEKNKMTVAQVMQMVEAREKEINQADKALASEQHEVIMQKNELLKPYRQEAAHLYITAELKPEWTAHKTQVNDYAEKRKQHESAGMVKRMFGNHGTQAEALEQERQKLIRQEAQLEKAYTQGMEQSEKGMYTNRRGYNCQKEIDDIAGKIASKKDPDYDKKIKTLDSKRTEIQDQRKALAPESKFYRDTKRELQNYQKERQIEITLKNGKINQLDLSKDLERQFALERERARTRERDRGLSR